MTIIRTERLAKRYGDTVALDSIDLTVEAGGIVGLLGPNGAGKTTLLEIFEGLRPASAGRVTVLGLDPLTDRERQTLRLAEEGLSSPEIADRLALSDGTVRNYLSSAISKLDASNRTEAARLARQKGWL